MSTPCELCGGAGVLYVDDTRVKQCRCVFVKKLRLHLGPEISDADKVTESVFLVANAGKIVKDLTTENLFIESSWANLLPHLKYTLGSKGLTYYFRITNDERIKTVFVGAESYKSRSIAQRETTVSYNDLGDYIGEMYDLVILRFGALGYPNRAVAGAIKESLLIREFLRKPTWLVSTPDNPFESTHAYEPGLGTYISKHYRTITLDSTGRPDIPENKEEAPGMSIVGDDDEKPPEEERALEPADEPGQRFDSDDISNDPAVSGGGKSKKRRWN